LDICESSESIENHGVIGNMRSAATVSLDGTIDFFCFPNFYSPSVFAALLDTERGGFFRIHPELETVRLKQLYLPDTNILLTRYLSRDAVVEIIDFMPVDENGGAQSAYAHQIIRKVKAVKGPVRLRLHCAPRFDYARRVHSACKQGNAVCFRPQGDDLPSLALHASIPLEIQDSDAVAEFTLQKGETAAFAFGMVREEELGSSEFLNPEAVEKCFEISSRYWRDWIKQSTYKGRWWEVVTRSALVLKLLFSQEHGSTVAAVTFGLPEEIGGTRNWDYRYTWLRDSSFCLYALIRLGLSGEIQSFTQWLRARLTDGLKQQGQDGPLRVMYRPDGSNHLDEIELNHLSGYKGSRPVRIGNRATEQLQLDIYGEIMDAVYLSNKYSSGISKDGWQRVIRVMEWLRDNWNREDEGIWEFRGGRKHLLHSRLMCWVAFDRVIRLSEKRSLDAPLSEWYEIRRKIDADILDNFWDDELKSFVQIKGEKALDASLLLMPMLRYISPTDPRWLSTLDRIEEQLTEDNFVYRYKPGEDGIDGGEGSFTACSFWLVECLARAGRLEKARLLFNMTLGYANHLGLFSEQLGTSGEHLGNFPQALTHLALISAATYLDRKLNGAKETWA
jgi:GH15 family glucan-1,4-alpha-glucosidase